jgi:ribosomal protein S18 acetylase RimI-like enzyme
VLDTNVQLARDAAPMAVQAAQARFAEPGDERGVRAIAGDAFTFDRFHRDPAIDSATAARIKADWAGNFFAGQRGDWMVVAGKLGKPEGFLQLLKRDDGTVVIDLVAVSSASRGQGLAQAMIAFAAEACLSRAATMRVGTQIANLPSLALYDRLGFRIVSAGYVLHLHR